MSSDLHKLEYLNLVSQLVTLIFNHLDMKDPSLAEYVISLHCPKLEDFKAKLDEVEAGFPMSLVQGMHRMILTLHPKYNKPESSSATPSTSSAALKPAATTRNEGLFPGLAMPDSAPDTSVPDISDLLGSLEKAAPSRQERAQAQSRDDRDRGRKRSRYDEGPEHQRDYRAPLDAEPVLFKIYSGTVSNIRDFGAFVSLQGIQGRHEGMVHVSAIQNGLARGVMPRDILTKNQSVKVKVLSAAGGRLSLSMKDVDQRSGMDLTPHLRPKTAAEIRDEDNRYRASAGSGANSIRLFSDETATFIPTASSNARSTLKRMSSPERWEIKQLIASGAAKASDYPELDEDFGTINGSGGAVGYEIEEELDIEIQDAEPAFLAGQTRVTLDLSPIKLVKAPDGTLGRAAVASSAYAKERKELKQQEEKELADSNPRDVNSAWLDPMTNPAERQFAQDARSGSNASGAKPAWKIASQPKISSLGDLNRAKMSMKQQRESLPVFRFREQLLDAVRENQVLVVRGETGSGKTTQMTQYLAEAGYADRGQKIGCTQPRRVAATSVAKRVADEIGCTLGQEVGYSIRFEDCTSPATKIKYMTDGLLLRECLIDPDMSQYSVIILDEAHERTVQTDILFGLIKKTLKKRPDLKFICTSATLDSEKFSEYFDQAKMFNIPGRAFPVEVLYTKEPESDYLDAALITVMQIHLSEPAGDILVFLTGKEEIDTSCEILHQRMQALGSQVPGLIILPMYSALPAEVQSEIFDPAPPGARKVIVSTNIAETSITVDGVFYVIDPGFSKQNAYDPKLHMQTLVVTPISQAQANQRSGRAGRTGPGKAYRLYTEAAFRNEMMPNPIPAIQRENLCSIILTLKAMGINDLLHFDFMDPPSPQTLISALENLYSLSALDNEGLLTRLGRKMADFPLDPELSKMLITSVELGCSEEAMTIIAMLSEQSIFFRPKDKQAAADAKKAKFHQPEGDHLTLLAVYNGWKASKFSSPWCSENFIQARSMAKVEKTRKQILGLLDRHRSDIISCGRDYNKIRRAIAAGFFANAAKKDPQEGYKTLAEGTPVAIHPSSSLFNKNPDWVLYHSLISTTKEYMNNVMAIEPKWLTEVAPNKYKIADATKISKRKRNERIEPLFNKFEEKDSWRLSKQKSSSKSSQTFG